jgi:hypothetical protein
MQGESYSMDSCGLLDESKPVSIFENQPI